MWWADDEEARLAASHGIKAIDGGMERSKRWNAQAILRRGIS